MRALLSMNDPRWGRGEGNGEIRTMAVETPVDDPKYGNTVNRVAFSPDGLAALA